MTTLTTDRVAAKQLADYVLHDEAKYARDVRSWYVYNKDEGRFVVDDMAGLEALVYKLPEFYLQESQSKLAAGDANNAQMYSQAASKVMEATKVERIIRAARSLEEVKAFARDFDTDPLTLNVADVTLQLPKVADQDVKSLPHQPGLMITKVAGVEYDPGAKCPAWEKFILTTCNDDPELATYVQQLCGYMLTGLTTVQQFWFLYGGGANGKSTFLTVVKEILGGYARKLNSIDLSTDMARKQEEKLAAIRGARLVIASEINSNMYLNEGLVKDITGGDPVSGRELYGKNFDMELHCKLVMYGNHKPKIKGRDEGMWRRVRLIPFTHQIPQKDVDPNLISKLREEYSGILNWMIEGYYLFLADGLKTVPKVVEKASEKYRRDQDYMSRFIDLCLEPDLFFNVPAADVRDAFEEWALNEEGWWDPNKKITTRRINKDLRSRVLTVKGDSSNNNVTSIMFYRLSSEGESLRDAYRKSGGTN